MTEKDAMFIGGGLLLLAVVALIYFVPAIATVPYLAVKHGMLIVAATVWGIFGEPSFLLMDVIAFLSETPYSGVTLETMNMVTEETYWFGDWLFAVAIIASGVVIIVKKKKKPYHRSHTVESLLDQETKTLWRFNRYLVNNNPFDESDDIRKGKYRMQEEPYAYLKKRKLIKTNKGAPDTVHVKAFNSVFIEQLGKPLESLESLNENDRIVVAIFLASLENVFMVKESNFDSKYKALARKLKKSKGEKGRNYAINVLAGDVAFWLNGELNKSVVTKQVDAILEEYWDSEYVNEMRSKHAYVYTFIRRLYIEVKRQGTFQPAYLSFMKMLDRRLWYVLHSTGIPGMNKEYEPKENMPGANIEVAMIIRHYSAERHADQALIKPEINSLQSDVETMLVRRFEKQII